MSFTAIERRCPRVSHVSRLVIVAACAACSSTGTAAPGSMPDADSDGGGMPASPDAAVRPDAATCEGEASLCLFGTVAAEGFAVQAIDGLDVFLYRVFPSGTQMPIAHELVASDGTWAFSGGALSGDAGPDGGTGTWSHYYVALVAGFVSGAGANAAPKVTAIVGPLAVPNAGTQVDLVVTPATVAVSESNSGAGAQVDWATGRLVDPGSGIEVTDAAVAITVRDASIPMPWDPAAMPPSYRVTFPEGTAAQPSYDLELSGAGTSLPPHLVAQDPPLVGSITSPPQGVPVPPSLPLTVSWTSNPQADYELVELFRKVGAGWSLIYYSPAPLGPDITSIGDISISPDGGPPGGGTPEGGAPASYLVNVLYARANCPSTAAPTIGGCVYATSIAASSFTAQ